MIVEEVINQFVLEEVTDETIVLYEGSLITQTLDSLVAADIATVVHAATSKTIPIDADELAIVDTAASNVLKKLTHINLYNYLKTKFDLVYTTLSSTVTSVFGRTGAVVAAINDYTWAQINKTTSSIADITTRNLSDLTQTASYRTVTDTEKGTWNGKQDALGYTAENTANKDATGGYVGLTLFKINFKNVLNTITSFLTNSNTVARTYTFQNRDGTIADDTDLSGKQNSLGFTPENVANLRTSFQVTPDDTHYISEKLAKDSLDGKQVVMGADDNYVTDAEKTVIGNTSGTNSGDNATNSQYSGLAASKENVLTGAASKLTIHDNDKFIQLNSESADATSYNLFSLIKSTLKTYNDTLYFLKSIFTAVDEIQVGTGAGTTNQITLAASQFLGKKATGAVTNLTATEARAILNVADGANVSKTTSVWYEVKTYAIQGAIATTDVFPPFEVNIGTNDAQTIIKWSGAISSGTSATLKLQQSNGSGGAFADIANFTGFVVSGGFLNPSSFV